MIEAAPEPCNLAAVNKVRQHSQAFLAASRRYAKENGIGVAVSLVLHSLLAFLALVVVARHAADVAAVPPPPFVPVDLIRLADETRAPPATLRAPVPQQKGGRPQQAASPNPAAVSATGKKPAPVDALDAKLHALARLKQPDSPLKIGEGEGPAPDDASNGAPAGSATYAIRDYVLAQVLRRWTLNLERTRERPLVVKIAVVMKRDGTILAADIVEQARTKTDVVFRDVAIGARNAVLLSSPIALPPGDYPKEMRFTLALDSRAVLR